MTIDYAKVITDFSRVSAQAQQILDDDVMRRYTERRAKEEKLNRDWSKINQRLHHVQGRFMRYCNHLLDKKLHPYVQKREQALEFSERLIAAMQEALHRQLEGAQLSIAEKGPVDVGQLQEDIMAAKAFYTGNATMNYVTAVAPILEEHKSYCAEISKAFEASRAEAKKELNQALKAVQDQYALEHQELINQNAAALVERLEEWMLK